jgi:hypothetical protein
VHRSSRDNVDFCGGEEEEQSWFTTVRGHLALDFANADDAKILAGFKD